jgi:hypothetical protein
MILVLAHYHDAEAHWLCHALRLDGRRRTTFLCPEAMGVDYSISLRLRNDGNHFAKITFIEPNACSVNSNEIRFAVNRLNYIEPLVWKSAAAGEQLYATSELNAFFPAVIQSLECPVDNPVHHGALWTHDGFAAQWAVRLHRLGVAIHPLAIGKQSAIVEALRQEKPADLRRWMVFNRQVFTPAGQAPEPSDIAHAISALATEESLEFIAVRDRKAGTLQVLHVSRTPALSCYGQAYIGALIACA